MSVPIHVLTIEARNEDGDYVEVKLSGFTTIPDEAQVDLAKKSASDLFEWGFGEQPEEILVHDSMKHRAEREGEDEEDDDDNGGEGRYVHQVSVEGRQFIFDLHADRRVYEVVNIKPGDTATGMVAARRLNRGDDLGGSADNLKELR